MPYTPCLPDELWMRIFRFATLSHYLEPSRDYDYWPFAPFLQKNEVNTLDVKLSLILVCRNWRNLATELLYEEIEYVRDYGPFKFALEGKGLNEFEGYGRLVRRLMNIPWFYPVTLDIVNHCGRLETLTIEVYGRDSVFSSDLSEYRPKVVASPKVQGNFLKSISAAVSTHLVPRFLTRLVSPNAQLSAQEPQPTVARPLSHQLPYLKRLDWTELGNEEDAFYFFHEIIRHTPNLRCLTIVESEGSSLSSYPTVVLPSLTTLRIVRVRDRIRMEAICRWSLPSLTHLVVLPYVSTKDRAVAQVTFLCNAFGRTLRSVELSSYLFDSVPIILPHCPKLQELSIRGLASPDVPFLGSHPTMSVIRLLSYGPPRNVTETWYEEAYHGTFENLCALRLPALQRMVLHGNWTDFLNDARFHTSRRTLQGRGWPVELEDGTSVDLDDDVTGLI